MGAREFLKAILGGTRPLAPVYRMIDDEQRENFIERKLVDYRRLAREHPSLLGE